MKKLILSLIFLGIALLGNTQSSLSGTITDTDDSPLVGATVFVVGTNKASITDLDGNFLISGLNPGAYNIEVAYLGYQTMVKSVDLSNGDANLDKMMLSEDGIGLEEILVVADVAIDRKTPVAVSTLYQEEIEQKLGNQEFPEILKMTPSIYATKSSGGFGDARINVRGFKQEDVALLINGIPVNGMEDNKIYWSNWAGLGDVTRNIQVQRGLGASKLAVASVGGTINIITKTTDQEKGGSIFQSIGNDGYSKTGLTLSTGAMDNGWAFTFSGSRTTGDGYIEYNYIDAWSYFFSASKQLNEKNLIMLTGFGAPQRHGQRSFEHGIRDQRDRFGIKWNDDSGIYQGSDFGWRENFYHKPQVGLSHIFDMNETTDIVTSFYGSVGRGGGTGDIGSTREFLISNNVYGHEDFDAIAAWNSGQASLGSNDPVQAISYSNNGAEGFGQIASKENGGIIKRASMNEHQWFGVLSNVTKEINNTLTFSGGIDLRMYTGSHYRKVIDLLGAEYWFDDDNINNKSDMITYVSGSDTLSKAGHLVRPTNDAGQTLFGSVPDDEKIDYHNDENINWYGTFGQLEYSDGTLSAFASGAVNYTQMRRTDFFAKTPDENTTDWLSFIGGNVKLGANYNISGTSNVFANVGYISRAPYFDVLFPTFNNDEQNDDAQSETVLAFEAGYGYSSPIFSANINGYFTQWQNKAEVADFQDADGNIFFLNLLGVNALHTGIEFDGLYRLSQNIDISLMASLGNWQWKDNPLGTVSDDDQNVIGESELFLDGIKVGDAAQTTLGIGAAWAFVDDLSLDLEYRYYDNLYAAFDPIDRDDPDLIGVDPLKLPSYGLADLGLTWKFAFGGQDASFRFNVNNLFDTEYIAEAVDRQRGEELEDAIENTRGWFGFGRTWNMTLRLAF